MTTLTLRAAPFVALRAILAGTLLGAASLGAQAAPQPASAPTPPPGPTLPVIARPPAPPRVTMRAPDGAEATKPKEAPVPEANVPKPETLKAAPPEPAPPPGEATRVRPAIPTTSAGALTAATAAPSETPPANATGRCRDGTFVTAPVNSATCSSNGGVLAIFPVSVRIPPPPKRP